MEHGETCHVIDRRLQRVVERPVDFNGHAKAPDPDVAHIPISHTYLNRMPWSYASIISRDYMPGPDIAHIP